MPPPRRIPNSEFQRFGLLAGGTGYLLLAGAAGYHGVLLTGADVGAVVDGAQVYDNHHHVAPANHYNHDDNGPTPDDIMGTIDDLSSTLPTLHEKNAYLFFGGAGDFSRSDQKVS